MEPETRDKEEEAREREQEIVSAVIDEVEYLLHKLIVQILRKKTRSEPTSFSTQN